MKIEDEDGISLTPTYTDDGIPEENRNEDVDIEKSQIVDNLMNCIENIKKMTLEYIELTIFFDKRLEKSDIWNRFDNLGDEIRMEDIHNLLEKNEKVEIKKR